MKGCPSSRLQLGARYGAIRTSEDDGRGGGRAVGAREIHDDLRSLCELFQIH